MESNNKKRTPTIQKLTTYRGAVLYSVNELNTNDGQLLNYKVVAKAVHPERENLLVDFIGEANTDSEAIRIVKKKIDDYLSTHSLSKLTPEAG